MSRPIILAAGGTGGHLFPAQALATALLARDHSVALITDRRAKAFEMGGASDFAIHRIRAEGINRPGISAKLGGAMSLGLGTIDALALLRRLKPGVVVGFGGYPSVPSVVAAQLLGIPTVLHEQNAVLGRANRLLAPRARMIATSFRETLMVRAGDRAKLAFTGNPVRPDILAVRNTPYPPAEIDGKLSLLVTGGSQGATIFSDVLPAALALLPEGLRARLRIEQQARPEDVARVEAAYADIGMAAEVQSFFADMPARLTRAHLVICRSGASTVAELTAAGRPAVLVPYLHAMDDHQTANARAIEDAGGAWVMPQTAFCAKSVADRLEMLLAMPQGLIVAAEKMRAAGTPDAVDLLADLVLAQAPANGGVNPVLPKPQEKAA
ncbi:MAG: undecaprenyldiphospho-muramoylpentapeptide beta-N-acetylglucosaminyltransferase [Alphaproteobacteria bacterium]|nr:undecaprenyldiphospho-muramoylpentapeptide beta-N-acetylglucosaminyltransferase [Alphaproteobacteria bacterium]MBU0795678.1 undecaprenyldiphospho-muramoylpentapeptide beta-N-acetylglucosaminyltransferase [Alphaproteobacteria bacterium]MBU0887301.1 undecaprenyldiphospho-muramoylpentapeptide beta-N-acetylglucosaminyltransferase [Alphaproteobacteria bacterium]MBU1811818.1 undecaprenyldiphospho-muramoylpentapeptide beta-N-acetylglucosaminyltransferase [Alphaproteobacteria bacterium]